MTLDTLYGFVFLGLFSPGPNVVLITSSGARFGFRRTLPHMVGVALGVGVIAAFTALGIAALLTQLPMLQTVLKFIAVAWILRMAWGLWQANPLNESDADRPMNFLEAVLFQWVNPKIWAVALAAIAAYPAGLSPLGEAARLAGAFSGINMMVVTFWSLAGALLAYMLKTPLAWQLFNRAMALALAGFSLALLV